MFSQIVLLLSAFIYVVSATARRGTIKGRLDLAASNITGFVSTRTSFKLYQIGNFSTEYPYTSTTMFQDDEGNFEFANLPLNDGVNETTYYVMYPASMDFNLKPNRILIEFKNLENGTLQLNAFKNFFGREYFPSKNITYPEKLQSMKVHPYITVELLHKAPIRSYLQARNVSIFSTGIVGNILNSRWKLAGVITLIALVVFPIIVEKLDPETARAIREEAKRKQREKYAAVASK
ncbi:CCQ_1a_G0027540.mRNA.1.CDS.1 [Saccharomyces cerevisiae]|nr:CCQ_1a_G0027540.mRNA.1.CDS.1 [Saccharomyces cerevisiae]CAI7341137.1 CCQ_1a_G0027540.mRNA.1.CDS.1 [Saccharomyces cerevisiae]